MEEFLKSQIQKTKELIKKGEYDESLQIIEGLEKQSFSNPKDFLRVQLLQSVILRRMEKFKKSLAVAEKVFKESKQQTFTLEELKALIAMASANKAIGNYDQALENVLQGEKLLNSLSNKQASSSSRQKLEADLYQIKGSIFRNKRSYDQAIELLHKARIIQKQLDEKFSLASTFQELGIVLWLQGKLDQALEYFQQCLSIRREFGNQWDIVSDLINIGIIYIYKGELETALDYQFQSLALCKKLRKKTSLANVLNNIGEIYGNYLGEPTKALEFFERSLKIDKELSVKIDNRMEIAIKLLNIGGVYEKKGEFDIALDYFQDSLYLLESLQENHYLADCLQALGDVYRKKGEFTKALELFQKSLAFRQEIGNKVEEASTLYSLIALTVDMQSLTKAEQFLDQLEQLRESKDNKLINLRYRLSKAIFLKVGERSTGSLRFKSLRNILGRIVTSQRLLREIITEEIVVHSLTIDAIFNLCEMLIIELKTLGNNEVLKEVQLLTQELLEISNEKYYFALLAKTYFLQAKLALLKPDIKHAKQLLVQAQAITKEKGYDRLAIVITQELKRFEGNLPEWLLEEGIPFIERLGKLQLEELVISLRQDRVEFFMGKQTTPSMHQLYSFAEALKKRQIGL